MPLEYGGSRWMQKTELTVALSYTKQRTMFGAVGIEVDPHEKIAYVRLAKQWSRDDMNSIPGDLTNIYDKVKWDMTFADHQIGLHLVRNIENKIGFGIHTITTQKNLKEAENIDAIKVMDMTEMVQLTLALKQEHRIQWPAGKFTKDMEALMKQMEMFQESVTEAGTVSYYAPGEELDSLPKALMIALFGNRIALQDGLAEPIFNTGPEEPKTVQESEDDFLKKALGEDSGNLSQSYLNRMSRNNLFRPKIW